MLEIITQFLFKTAVIVLLFGLLILVHEWGHFMVARLLGVRVLRFSIGFGPKIVSWKRGDTEYWLSWVPLGGYVKMAGESPADSHNEPYEFTAKPVWARALIVLAGPFVNYVSALIFMWFFLIGGYPGIMPVVGEVLEDTPAAQAGFIEGDRILSIDDERVYTWDEMTAIIHASPEEPLNMAFLRSGEVVRLTVTPRLEELEIAEGQVEKIGLIGIAAGGLPFGPVEAVKESFTLTSHWTILTLKVLGGLLTGQQQVRDTVTGPIGIVYLTSRAVDMGIGPLLMLMCLFSLSLAIFNVLPIPVLDGGHLLFLLIEKIKGSAVSIAVQEKAMMVGMTLLLMLAVFISFHDIMRYFVDNDDAPVEEPAR